MKNYLYIIFILGIIGCNDSSNKIEEVEIKLNYIGEKSFPLDETSSNIFFSHQFLQIDGRLKFTFLNQVDREIKFYDYYTEKLENSLGFDNEGPNAVGNIARFRFINEDSILLFGHGSNTIYHYSLLDSLVKGIKFLTSDEIGLRGLPPRLAPGQIPIINRKRLILTSPHNVTPINRPGIEILKNNERNIITEIDYFTGKKLVWGNYPKNFNSLINNLRFYDVYVTPMIKSDSMLVSFSLTDSVYIYNQKRERVASVKMGNEYNNKNQILTNKNNIFNHVIDDEMYQRITNNCYTNILIDQYREFYLRFMELGKSDHEIDKVQNNRYLRDTKDFKIIVFNKNFKYIGSINTPSNTRYNFYNSYVTKEGLFIFNIDKNLEHEDKIIFDHFMYDF